MMFRSGSTVLFFSCLALSLLISGLSGCKFNVKKPPLEFPDVGGMGDTVESDTGGEDSVADSITPDSITPDLATPDADVPEAECAAHKDCETRFGAPEQCHLWKCLETGKCSQIADDGLACDDKNACTEDSCKGGVCVGKKISCDDGDMCTLDTCSASTGCVYEKAKDGSVCNDENPCTLAETCQNGICTPNGYADCDDDNECTMDWCDEKVGCKHEEIPECGDCFKEGTAYPDPEQGENLCCQGLVGIMVCDLNPMCGPDEICIDPCSCEPEFKVCAACGDGFCGIGENPCNCFIDCGNGSECFSIWDCPEGTFCASGKCCMLEELCGDQIDNNCNGKVDEGCPGEVCPTPPSGYIPVALKDLVANPGMFAGKNVYASGVTKPDGNPKCVPIPGCSWGDNSCCKACTGGINLVDEMGNTVALVDGSLIQQVGCKGTNCNYQDNCTPAAFKKIQVWGEFKTAITGPRIVVENYCVLSL